MFCGRAGEKFLVNLLIINIPQNPVLFNTKNKHIDKYVPCMLQHEKDHVFSSSEPNPISSLSFSVSPPRAMISATFSATVAANAFVFGSATLSGIQEFFLRPRQICIFLSGFIPPMVLSGHSISGQALPLHILDTWV